MNFLKAVWEYCRDFVKILCISLILAGAIRYFVVQPFFVQGASMEPNFENGEYLVIDEISYYFRIARRGEVVVFHYPLNVSKYYIKRIVGLPGETVEIKNGKVKIYNIENPEGLVMTESYLPKNLTTDGDIKRKLNENEYFVLGDNRKNSSDSRYWGSLPKNDIVGRVWIRAFPFGRFETY